MPELPQMQALSERLAEALVGAALVRYDVLGFSGLKTAVPPPDSLIGQQLASTGRRGKYLILNFATARILVHLSQAGRLDIEEPPKRTKPRGSIARLVFDDDRAILLREHGTERKAGWWVVALDHEGPMAALGPEATSDAFAELLRTSTAGRQVHTLLRDQRTVAGIGRGYADDALQRARISPFAPLRSLSAQQREELLAAIHAVLEDGIERERARTGGLSENKLGEHFTIHNRFGQPCPTCGTELQRVSFESHTITYCPTCQTNGKLLADRRMSRLLR